MYKACSRCGKIHPANFVCTKGKEYNGGEERKLRSRYAWAKKSREIRDKSSQLCEVCRAEGIYTYNNLEVHHIDKVRDNSQGLLDNYNLITLCVMHHKDADAGKIDKEYLRRLAYQREEGIPPYHQGQKVESKAKPTRHP